MRPAFPLLAGLVLAAAAAAAAPGVTPIAVEETDGLRVKSGYLDVMFSLDHPALVWLAVDSLGGGRVHHNVLSVDSPSASAYTVTRGIAASGPTVEYSRGAVRPGDAPEWVLSADGREIHLVSRWSEERQLEPLTVSFDTHLCYATLLGLFSGKGDIGLPAVLHLPGFGSFRLGCSGRGDPSVGYASGPGWIRVTFPPADAAHRRVEYRWTVAAIYPEVEGTEGDARYDGFRRNWLNILQLNPNRGVLANNTDSDTCGFCYYEYADIARDTPPLAGNLYALDMVRQSLERVFAGMKTYGMPGYGDFPEETSDTAPSLLIAAFDYAEGRNDAAWLRAHYPALRAMADKMLSTDHDGDGLIKYVASGNSGTWNEGQPKVRPSNWWDTVGFGHEDAYANALAYRALLGMRQMADEVGNPADAGRYGAAAVKLHDAYFGAFYDPSTGVLAGWRSADGRTHDYYFTFVNGIAVLYGLVPDDRAPAIMDRLWDEMGKVGYTDFRLGLPGNLIPIARKDYAHLNPRYGGGIREDNADGFQIYQNGGASACFAYFTIAAFDHVGQHARAAQILLPILNAFDDRVFEGVGPNKLTNDWRKWDGTAEGYEGFLTDNYYALLAVPGR
jgi:alpha-L-rhamnosidase-like protein